MIALLRRRGNLLANLAVLLVLVVGVYHVGFNILRLQLARHPFTVALQLPASGGLYPRSEVDYRGKLVGEVSDIKLVPDGVVANLRIDEGTRIPADLDAAVADLSPAGEQFVDLRPRVDSGPLLHAGSVIPRDRTSLPLTIPVVVADVSRLLDQFDTGDLNTVVSELATALSGTGPAMAGIIENSDRLLAAAQKDLPSVTNLLNNGRVDVDTGNQLSGEFAQFNTALRELTKQLRSDDPTVDSLLASGPGLVTDLDKFVTTLTSPISTLLGNLISPGSLIAARIPALNALLIAFPQATAALRTTVKDGNFTTELHLTGNPTCNYGTPRRTPIDATRHPADLNRVCKDATPGVGARGAQNAPRPAPSGPGSGSGPSVAWSTDLAGYDPRTGMVLLPDGSRLNLGIVRGAGTEAAVLALLLSLLRQ
ncbi:MAG TPA: MlaD family protein [Sporichthyaceae bacterium]|jgi:phospholipid/cholesterol/gamma-HCH transport system substrate-binding protein|nr:MlaD family protein [Sporichthyaceae bacterium]